MWSDYLGGGDTNKSRPPPAVEGGVSIDRRRPAAGESAGPAASAGALGIKPSRRRKRIYNQWVSPMISMGYVVVVGFCCHYWCDRFGWDRCQLSDGVEMFARVIDLHLALLH